MYIKDLSCISPQLTFNEKLFDGDVINHDEVFYRAQEPDYMEIIPHRLLRRMGRVVKFGITSGLELIKRNENIDGIIIGTANGGLEDCFKFLDQIMRFEEGTLTPTNFVQSTPNAVAGNLALMSNNNGYNNTHVNGALSFENALVDAKLLLEECPESCLLVGSADEISQNNFNINKKLGLYKSSGFESNELINSQTEGTVIGEGASMFVIDNMPDNAISKIVDVDQIVYPTSDDLMKKLDDFLNKNQISKDSVDTIITGRNGDIRYNQWYDLIEKQFEDTNQFTFKNLVGEYQTASGFAVWLATKLISGKKVPKQVQLKMSNHSSSKVLLYNNYRGVEHSFILVESV